jgi:exopolysaccharide biosynthesis polyprenyl glycosylphosphotransferase
MTVRAETRDSGTHRRYSGGASVVHYETPVSIPMATEADGTGAARRLSARSVPGKRVATFLGVCRYLDIAVVLTVVFGVFLLVNSDHPGAKGVEAFLQMRVTVKNVLLLALLGCSMQVSLRAFGMYDEQRFAYPPQYVVRLVAACLVGMTPAMILFPLASRTGAFGPMTVAYFVLATVATLLVVRGVIWIVAAAPPARLAERHVLIVGSGPRAVRLFHELATHRGDDGIRIAGFVDTNADPLADEVSQRLLGDLDQLERILMEKVVDDVLITLPIKSCYEQIQQTIALCERLGVRAAYLADVFQSSLARPTFEQTGQIPVVRMHMVANDTRLVFKRALDMGLSGLGLVVLAPVMVLIALAICLDSRGHPIFAQERFGFNKRRFRMYKFRTMITDAESLQGALEDRNEACGPVFKIRDDPRVTRIGKFLRKTSLDELPQLWNVFRGDMSLVGPRPLPLRDVHRFSESWLMRRFSVRPGVTGLWQVSGRSDLSFSRWVALDLQYIDRWSLGLDLKILAMTVPAVLKGRGAA